MFVNIPQSDPISVISCDDGDTISLDSVTGPAYIPVKNGTVTFLVGTSSYEFAFDPDNGVSYRRAGDPLSYNVTVGDILNLGGKKLIVGHIGSIVFIDAASVPAVNGSLTIAATAHAGYANVTWTPPSLGSYTYKLKILGNLGSVQEQTTVSANTFSAIIDGLVPDTYTISLTATAVGVSPITIGTTVIITSAASTPPTPGSVTPVPCFLGTAPVLTPTGYHRMDSLEVGDIILTADHKEVAIQRISRTQVTPSASTNPYIIPKGHLGATKRLLISPNHSVLVDGKMVEARLLGLQQEDIKEPFVYYNLELPEWSNMIVAGVEVESLAPKKRIVMSRATFNAELAKIKDKLTPASFRTLMKNCKFLEDGSVVANFIVGRSS